MSGVKTILLDMDGVLAEDKGLYDFLGAEPLPYSHQLVSLAFSFTSDVQICSQAPGLRNIEEKVSWLLKHFPEARFTRLNIDCYPMDKARYASPSSVLIDDRADHCFRFRAAGGSAVQYNTSNPQLAFEEVSSQLREFFK